MTTTNFTEIDNEIFDAIRERERAFHELSRMLSEKLCAIDPENGWRVLDRRLQALRRRGLIKPVRCGRFSYWHPVEKV